MNSAPATPRIILEVISHLRTRSEVGDLWNHPRLQACERLGGPVRSDNDIAALRASKAT